VQQRRTSAKIQPKDDSGGCEQEAQELEEDKEQAARIPPAEFKTNIKRLSNSGLSQVANFVLLNCLALAGLFSYDTRKQIFLWMDICCFQAK
jgi:hypothetical protein